MHDAIAWRDAAIAPEMTRHPLDLLEQRPIRDGRAEVLDRRLVRIAARRTCDVSLIRVSITASPSGSTGQ
ncbi:hypothetical protein [Verminephrobacter eiseniae]|uniref:hypothetical protein n=1 Tax=Verminephrobacter eiseniae TaxID=364317 RepID=UPI0018DCB37D|nr:hypothetical protein [Verminephrobacter eiseniae]